MTNVPTRRLVLSTLLAGAATAAFASDRQPFGVGYANPGELARDMREYFKTDPEGKSPVSKRCLANGYSCASAQQYLAGFKKADPQAGLQTVKDLPDYLETLVRDSFKGEAWMACLKKGTREMVWNCLTRPLEEGEPAWKNPKTGRFVLANNCANPIGELIDTEECLYVDYYLMVEDEVHIFMLGKDPLPITGCLGIQRAGEVEWSNVLHDECPRYVCDARGPVQARGKPLLPSLRVSYKAKKEGWHKLRLPLFLLDSENEVLLCVIKPDGTQSKGKIITKIDYARFDGRMVAFVGYPNYQPSAVPQRALLRTWVLTPGRVPAD